MTFDATRHVHVPLVVTEGLCCHNVDVLTAQDDRMQETDDEALLQDARDLLRLLFTQDDDLFAITDDGSKRDASSPGLIYSHQLETRIGSVIEDLEWIAVCASQEGN